MREIEYGAKRDKILQLNQEVETLEREMELQKHIIKEEEVV
jgi:hypothetical protein